MLIKPERPSSSLTRRRWNPIVLAALCLSTHSSGAVAEGLCGPLRVFVESVKPDESRTLEFHTSWGSDFRDSSDPGTLAARRCIHGGFGPAKAVCAFLMEHGVTEFAGNNAKEAVMCLSKKTHFAEHLVLDGIAISLAYGTENRGSHIDIKFSEDEMLGGMVLSITASGYRPEVGLSSLAAGLC